MEDDAAASTADAIVRGRIVVRMSRIRRTVVGVNAEWIGEEDIKTASFMSFLVKGGCYALVVAVQGSSRHTKGTELLVRALPST